jgi:hypothetical protein
MEGEEIKENDGRENSNTIYFLGWVLGLQLKAFTLSHPTSPIFVKGFSKYGLAELFGRLASNRHPPDLCLLVS